MVRAGVDRQPAGRGGPLKRQGTVLLDLLTRRLTLAARFVTELTRSYVVGKREAAAVELSRQAGERAVNFLRIEMGSKMNIWWLAISLKHTSYAELKHRKVVAQGWPELGDLTGLCPLLGAGNNDEFRRAVTCLEAISYGQATHAAQVMDTLLSIKSGDLVVGIEGVQVKGICQLDKNGWESYRLFFPDV